MEYLPEILSAITGSVITGIVSSVGTVKALKVQLKYVEQNVEKNTRQIETINMTLFNKKECP